MERLDEAMAGIYRRKTHGERLRIAFGLWSSTRIMLAGILRTQHPDWEEKKIQAEIARRMSHGTA